MKVLNALHALGRARSIGIFSWPVDDADGGMSSPQCSTIIGAEILDSAGFLALLSEDGRGLFLSAVESPDVFRIELELADNRLIEMTAVVEAGETCRVIHGTIEDVTQRRDEIARLTAREELCQAIAENSPAMLWMGDQNGKCVFLNQAQRDFWGVDPEDLSTFDWGSTLHGEDLETLSGPFVKAMADHTPFSVEARYLRADGQYRTMRTDARPRFDKNGTFLGMTGVNTDITDQLVAEAHTRMLMGELNHRTKNILSVVQAVARQTAKKSSAEEFNKTFGDRLIGLGASNDLLLRNDWTGVDMAEMVEAQFVHLRDLIGRRIFLSGPPMRVASTAAQTIGMALHELSTNSLKYGALATADGRVTLTWTVPDTPDGGFAIRWIESGVNDVTVPSRKGFGHSVIVDMVSSALDADVEVRFDGDGFKWLVSARSNTALVR
jgi:PAS domain S-box-containing protein